MSPGRRAPPNALRWLLHGEGGIVDLRGRLFRKVNEYAAVIADIQIRRLRAKVGNTTSRKGQMTRAANAPGNRGNTPFATSLEGVVMSQNRGRQQIAQGFYFSNDRRIGFDAPVTRPLCPLKLAELPKPGNNVLSLVHGSSPFASAVPHDSLTAPTILFRYTYAYLIRRVRGADLHHKRIYCTHLQAMCSAYGTRERFAFRRHLTAGGAQDLATPNFGRPSAKPNKKCHTFLPIRAPMPSAVGQSRVFCQSLRVSSNDESTQS